MWIESWWNWIMASLAVTLLLPAIAVIAILIKKRFAATRKSPLQKEHPKRTDDTHERQWRGEGKEPPHTTGQAVTFVKQSCGERRKEQLRNILEGYYMSRRKR